MSLSLQMLMADEATHLEAPPLRPPLANTSAPRDKEPPEADLEKLRKWQEERIARKLRGEYESAVLHLAEVVRDLEVRVGRDAKPA